LKGFEQERKDMWKY